MYESMTQDTHERPDCDTSVSTDAAVLLNGAAFRLGYRWDPFSAVWWDRCGTAARPSGLPLVRSCPIILRRCLGKSTAVHNGPTVSPDF
jgi:hypothetical protein